MKNAATKFLTMILSACLLLSSFAVTATATETWTPGTSLRIFSVSDSASSQDDMFALENEAVLFAAEYEAHGLGSASVGKGLRSAAGGSGILLAYDSTIVGEEEFRVSIEQDRLTIEAKTSDGIFYGWRYVIKELLDKGYVSETRQAPSVGERSLSLDNGRKYYSVEAIKKLIREMSYANMSALVLHFSEEMGLGLESKTYPWLAGRDGSLCVDASVETDARYLTQEELRDIAAYARVYHVELIPALDTPGHMNYIVKKVNEKAADADFTFTYDGRTYTLPKGGDIGNYFHYNGQTSLVKGSRNQAYSRGIDLSNEVAVAFTRSLLEEYGKLFAELGATRFDIGGDELLGWGTAVVSTAEASRWQQLDHWKAYAQQRAQAEGKTNWSEAVAYDAFVYYMNDLYELVTGLGYTSVRMWNDDALRTRDTGWKGVATLDPAINIWYWTEGNQPSETYTAAGHGLYNIFSEYTYYVLKDNYLSDNRTVYQKAYPDRVYDYWNPFVFDTQTVNSPADPAVLGGSMAIWSDNPTLRTEDEVIAEVLPLLRAIGAKSWDSQAQASVSYDQFAQSWTRYGVVPALDVTDLFVDYSQMIALVEEAKALEFDPAVHKVLLYQDFITAAEEAETYYLSARASFHSQASVDEMVEILQCSRDDLLNDPAGKNSYQWYVDRYYNEDLPAFQKGVYPVEYWIMYADNIQRLEWMISMGFDVYYDSNGTKIVPMGLHDLEKNIKFYRSAMELATFLPSVEPRRKEIINTAALQVSTCKSGGTVRIKLSTVRSFDVRDVHIMDENGYTLEPTAITILPMNRRNPKEQVLYIDLKLDYTPGVHSFTIYAEDKVTKQSGNVFDELVLFCGDPVTLDVTVVD